MILTMNKRHIPNHGLNGFHGFRLATALLLTALMAVGNMTAQVTVRGNVYGGGNLANVGGSVTVNMTGNDGVVEGDVYGGGALANTNTSNTTNTTEYTTAVNLTGGTIQGDAYGGGLGDAEHVAIVKGDVLVTLNGTKMVGTTTGENPQPKPGSLFGANNVNGTPKGHVKVLVQKTITQEGLDYDVEAVFGGGNLATYEPTIDTEYAEVEINKTTGEGIRLKVGTVYGGGNEAGITGGTLVNIVKGVIVNGVYGGCNTSGTVTKDVTVNIKDGTIGSTTWTIDNVPAVFPTVVFGGGLGENTLVTGNVIVNIGERTGTAPDFSYSGNASIWGDVYGGSAKGNVNAYWTGEPATLTASAGKVTDVNLYGGKVKGNLYGGGLGQKNGVGGATSDIAANVYGPVTVTVEGGGAANVFGCNNVNGAPQNSVTVNINGTAAPTPPIYYSIENVYGGGNQAAYTYTGSPLQVNITGGSVDNVFGGGLSADVAGSIAVTVTGGTVYDDVYGGGALANTNTAYWNPTKEAEVYAKKSGIKIDNTTPANTTIVTGLYELVNGNYVEITTANQPAVSGHAYYEKTSVTGYWESGYTSASASTTVTLTGGTVGNVYGGGLGQLEVRSGETVTQEGIEAKVYGDVTVTINKEDGTGRAKIITLSEPQEYQKTYLDVSNVEHTETVTGTVYKKGRVFGANNLNGTPKGNVTVTVWSTTPVEGTTHKYEADGGKYEIQAVYGGGNLANYNPVKSKETNVIIHGCERTSIQYVFGGGNAASVPDTHVDVFGTFEIEAVFGGGNGNEPVSYSAGNYVQNPGAEIIGDTYVTLRAGLMHQAFGGSFEKGTVNGTTHLEKTGTDGDSGCDLRITDIFGGGKDADVDNIDITLSGCDMSDIGRLNEDVNTQQIENVYAGSYNAKIKGSVNMTVRSGNFKNVFGGNYSGGLINGPITINIEETENCKPIKIGNLYGGGNYAAYPGPGANNEYEKKITINVKACTSIGNIYGGSFHADVEGDTEVNINMIKGWWAGKYYPQETSPGVANTNPDDLIPDAIGTIGNVYGGGEEGRVIGNTVVNIGNLTQITLKTKPDNDDLHGSLPPEHMRIGTDCKGPYTVLGANITGNVFGGGKLADVGSYHLDNDGKEVFNGTGDVTGSTTVNICAKLDNDNYVAVAEGASGVRIGGNVYGGGEGSDATFRCEKAMVTGGTTVRIGNGTIEGTVYGGGMIGRVEQNTEVTIGYGAGVAANPTSTPVITGNVFGAGAGVNTNGYSALVRGTSTVTVQSNAKVRKNVYGGGEVASVGRYKVENGLPVNLADPTSTTSGYCYVNILGYAEIGPTTAMKMRHDEIAVGTDKPDDYGHVFGAGKGVLPYEGYAENEKPKHRNQLSVLETYNTPSEEEDYFRFIQTLALATQAKVVVGDNAFVKGSVYGGSENGCVQHNTYVTIQGDCQIGCGKNTTNRHPDVWGDSYTLPDGTDLECDSWPYGAPYKPYDPNALSTGKYSNGDESYGMPTGSDGHTFYGNVFGGGSGYYPYKPGRWFPYAGQVKGNTHVTITGGHILTNVYGGNEMTDVGVYGNDLSVTSGRDCYVTMTGGTLGVPRTLTQIKNHPVTCYLFGAGKGDQRVFFNKRTNVGNTFIHVSHDARIYGSVFGGGEDGHVMGDVTMSIGSSESPEIYTITDTSNPKYDAVLSGMDLTPTYTKPATTITYPYIGTWGTTYVEGNVFGGGRGFGGDAYTAGNVGGSVTLTINGGTMLGNIYGGGRLGSVGYDLIDAGDTGYGEMSSTATRGHVIVNITGGTIGNDYEFKYLPNGADLTKIPDTDVTYDSDRGYYLLNHTKGGNVFAGGMGRRTKLDGTTPITVENSGIEWRKLGNVKSTKLTISGTPWIKGNVYGGGEFGVVTGSHTTNSKEYGTEINITGGIIGTVMGSNINNGTSSNGVGENNAAGDTRYSFGSVYGGGYGTEAEATTYETNVDKFGAWVTGNTYINISGNDTEVRGSVYGGGEMACVKGNTDVNVSNGEIGVGQVRASNTANGDIDYVLFGSWRMGNVYGAGKGSANAVSSGLVQGNTNVNISGGSVYHNVYGGGAYGSVGTYTLYSNTENSEFTPEGGPKTCTSGGTATVTITGGQIGINGWDNGMVCGSGRGDVSAAGGSDPYDRLAWVNNSIVTIGNSGSETSFDAPQPQIKGSLYGGGENGHNFGNTTVHLYSGTIGTDASKSYDNGNVYGSGCGTDRYWVDANSNGVKDDGERHHNRNAGFVKGNTTVNVHGGHVKNSVYGGGSMASVGSATTDKATLNISGGTIDGSVYGGAKGDLTDAELKAHVKASEVTISGGTIGGSVYGGGMAGVVEGNVKVYMTGGSIANDLYGGGALAHTNTQNVTGYADTDAHDKDYTAIDLVSASTVTTYVRLTGGTITGYAYGGALGRAEKAAVADDPDTPEVNEAQDAVTPIAARVFGNVKVNLNGMEVSEYNGLPDADKFSFEKHANNGIEYYAVKTTLKGCIVNRVFGANNINGTPKGNVTVNVWATQNKESSTVALKYPYLAEELPNTDTDDLDELKNSLNKILTVATGLGITVTAQQAIYDNASATKEEVKAAITDLTTAINDKRYDVDAVYGGGNEAAYAPATNVSHSPAVNIYDCDLTSIETVYGGGNAAAVPETNVTVFGAHEIYNVFGGGNGKDRLSSGAENPGANVNGDATTNLFGGRIHEAYGGSNTKGDVRGKVYITASDGGECPLNITKIVGAGNKADINTSVDLLYKDCSGTKVAEFYAGADNANVNGDINVTITGGEIGKFFAGNNRGGIVKGHIRVNVEETDCKPIIIDELYTCGNQAPYSKYGYYVVKDNQGNPVLSGNRLSFQPRVSATDTHLAVKTFDNSDRTYEEYSGTGADVFTPYDDPVLNIIACTRIGKVFGGGQGERAVVYGNPTVNINMIPGKYAAQIDADNNGAADNYPNALGSIGDVFGGGNEAHVEGNTTVNIGNASTVEMVTEPTYLGEKGVAYLEIDKGGGVKSYRVSVKGANITGNVYGGGSLANVGDFETVNSVDNIKVVSNTFVNIGATKGAEIVENNNPTGRYEYNAVDLRPSGSTTPVVTIGGNVFGGGKGEDAATMLFRCDKAMVTGSTNVCIGNGMVGTLDGSGNLVAGTGNVYGGGEVGRVEVNGSVTIGTESGTSAPDIRGNVFGAGKGLNTHGYSALMRGNSYVTIQGDATVGLSVYGGGEVASIGRYNVAQTVAEATEHGVSIGMPYSLASNTSGNCFVTVRGNAKIGPDNMTMPTFSGNVFGAGKGVLPYEGYRTGEAHAGEDPWRQHPQNTKDVYNQEKYGDNLKAEYEKYIQTLGLTTQTEVTIDGNAFVKGSVYGGSQNGIVQHDTHVTIKGNCQIGNGAGVNRPYTTEEWTAENSAVLKECASWTYGQKTGTDKYAPYDKYAGTEGYTTNASTTGDDGHTYYGNVFGGGSGVEPYKPGLWHNKAGHVGGNTVVDITGGHILTCVFGGNEMTSVDGTCTVNFSGTATLGVPRTWQQIKDHPVTCYLFGAGKGDARTTFDSYTNVGGAIVNVSGGKIYGSIFGGAEDGHVLGNVTVNISNNTSEVSHTNTKIGTWGTTYVDGNVFGGGRGYSGQNIYAGVVTGNVNINISDGTMLGSVYGGGRLGSVGINSSGEMLNDEAAVLYEAGDEIPEGKNVGDVKIPAKPHGHITIDISGGTIGNSHEFKYVATDVSNLASWKETNHVSDTEYETTTKTNDNVTTYIHRLKHTKGGNVYAGSMGRLYALDGSTPLNDWAVLGQVKSTKLTINGGTIKSNVYGGGELAKVTGYRTVDGKEVGTEIIINKTGSNDLTIGTPVENGSDNVVYTFGSVYGGGYGSTVETLVTESGDEAEEDILRPKLHAGIVEHDTKVTMQSGNVLASVYGGGETASVKGSTDVAVSGGTIGMTKRGNTYYGEASMGNVYGGGKGEKSIVRSGQVYKNSKVTISGSPTIYHNIYGGGAFASVGTYTYTKAYDSTFKTWKVTGISACEENTGTATVKITGGTIGVDGHENGMVFGSSRGDVGAPGSCDDLLAWVNDAYVEIDGADTKIKGSVYGGGENGHVFRDADVKVKNGTIGIENDQYDYRGNVYGAGCGTDKYYSTGTELYDGNGDKYNPLAGIVQGSTSVTISGGTVVRSVYGAGAMGSVGKITNDLEEKDGSGKYKYKHIYSDVASGTEDENLAEATTFYDFGLSWPLELIYGKYTVKEGLNTVTKTSGLAKVTIKDGSKIGVNVYGAARGSVQVGENDITKQRYEEAKLANVREAQVIIGTGSGTQPEISGSVYGGGEDGHVYENASVTINGGSIENSVFGGGKGEGTFNATLWNPSNAGHFKDSAEPVHSWTAGRVYGNTTVTINGGSVGYFIYGGGNLGSVGKGSYSGGSDDYSEAGYGELPPQDDQELWTNTDFTGSGIATVNLFGGTVGSKTAGTDEANDGDGIPYGSVFGGSRGKAAASCQLSPRYRYVPDFFLGYVNKTIINIGGTSPATLSAKSPTIWGSVYGGGQDGHVRNSTEVKIYQGTIAAQDKESDTAGRSGNVFGAGSGIGTYKDGNVKKVNNSSGSVTCTTLVEVNGGNISGSVYGGGALSSVGPPKTPAQDFIEFNNTTDLYPGEKAHGSKSYTRVDINGGTIGGNVFAANRGPSDTFYTDSKFDTADGKYDVAKYATDIWSFLNVTGGEIAGSVYGGSEGGIVKKDTKVILTGGTIAHDAFGGGKGTKYIEANVGGSTTVELNDYGEDGEIYESTIGCAVNRIFGCNDFKGTPKGHVKVHVHATQRKDGSYMSDKFPLRDRKEDETLAAYLGRLIDIAKVDNGYRTGVNPTTIDNAETTLAKTSLGTADDDLSDDLKAEIETAIADVKQELDNLDEVYDVAAVYGGGNLAMYKPDGPNAASADGDYKNSTENTEVIIDGCGLSSIKQVYGGGNAAPVPATNVKVNGCYEIDEVFGGGNGKDPYEIAGVYYLNPGANVGYLDYTKWTGSGTQSDPYVPTIKDDAQTKQQRQDNYRYGRGEAKTEIYGGRVHKAYGGSNEKGNISTTVISKYDENTDCPICVDETYGGGKNSIVDGDIDIDLGCVDYMDELFGGSKNADVNSNICLNVTNGTYGKVFGGNNTSGAIAGSITVNVKEQGCKPIIIGELYSAGYLAPYSIYGYKESTSTPGTYITEDITYEGIGTIAQRIPLTTGEKLFKEPRINVISATRIDNIFGGGYQALVVGSPHVNVNMEEGKILAKYMTDQGGSVEVGSNTDVKGNEYTVTGLDAGGNGILSLGTIGNVYGGGNLADISGDTYVEIGTGKWLKDRTDDVWQTTDAEGVVYEYNETSKKWEYITKTTEIDNTPSPTEGATMEGTYSGTYLDSEEAVEISTPTIFTYNSGHWTYEKEDTNTEPATTTTKTIAGTPSPVDGATMEGTSNDDGVTEPTDFTYHSGSSKWTYEAADAHTVAVNSTPTPSRNAAEIDGNVYGGGKGIADHFVCDKAMVNGKNGTSVVIANGTVKLTYDNKGNVIGGNVYGGGEIGRVENNTKVTVGLDGVTGNASFKPVVEGNVFGAGKGKNTHGYSALVRGTSTVNIQGDAKVGRSVYGGGEVASVGRYKVGASGLPEVVNSNTGYCFVTVKDNAEIGPDDMVMNKVNADGTHKVDANGDPLPPDDTGYVFGAGKGVLPYEGYADDEEPYHMNGTQHKDAQGNWDGKTWDDDPRHYPAYNNSDKNNENPNPAYYNEADYFKFVRSMALATQTEVKIEGNAFIKGGVYGGAENGYVQQNTHVVIEGNCQIGNGFVQMYDSGENDGKYLSAANMVSVNRRYTAKEWAAGRLFVENDPDIDLSDPTEVALRNAVGNNYQHSLPECASWPYGIDTNDDGKNDVFAPYDKYACTDAGHEEEYEVAYDAASTNGGRRWGSDGHTFYGNVFGGGSGYFPYRPGKWFEFAGAVHGNTFVEVKGGHILTCLYGGNEMTDVGNYEISASGDVNYIDGGTSYVTMTGGTLGVPRTLKQIAAHPVTCYLFGAGKGDQRIPFNESTNVGNAVIHVSDNTRIYGSVFGGGEDGHVIENVKLSIGSKFPTDMSSLTDEEKAALTTIKSAYTDAEWTALNGIKDGTMKVTTVSVSGTPTTETKNINYPLIGTTGTSYVDGNVFGAGRGFSGDALTAGSVGGNVEVNIEGGTMLGSIYGGGRLASVGIPFTYTTNSGYGSFKEDTEATDEIPAKSYGHVTVNISGGTIGNPYEDIYLEGTDKTTADSWSDDQWKTWKAANKVSNTEFEVTENAYRATHTKGGNVFGGSMGRLEKLDGSINRDWWPQLGQVKTTTVNISGDNTLIKSCVYGGGELGTVRDNTTVVLGRTSKDDTGSLTKPTIIRDIYGGGYGSKDYDPASAGYVDSEVTTSDNTTVHHIYRYTPIMWAGMVGKGTELNIYDGWVKRNVYGGGEMASVGILNYEIENVTGSTTTAADLIDTQYKTDQTWKYKYITKHHDGASSFALSWPYKTEYVGDYTGATHINVYGGRLGVSDDDNVWADNGDVYGGSKGMAGDRYVMAFCGNVGSSNILIDYPSDNGATLTNYLDNANGSYTHDCIVGAVYGGGEDGHVMGDTYVTLKNGLIGHAMYGGGSGKGKYEHDMKIIGSESMTKKQTYSLTAGKVYGDTHVKMEGGYVGRFVYGGGNMGSVGKGNYSGGADDYYKPGYGETITGNLWTSTYEPDSEKDNYNPNKDNAWYFLNSGKTEVEIFYGQVGYVKSDPSESVKDGLPYGSVFGGSRGESAPNIEVLPRELELYSPEFFSGYVNETKVTVGGYRCKEDNGSYKKGDWLTAVEFNTEFPSGNSKWELVGPTIKGSVFGGGQDGHVRRDTHVIVDAGEIGMAYNTENRKIVGTLSSTPTEEEIKSLADLDNPQWLHRGNVYGAGSGIGKYIFDFDNDKKTYTDKNNNDKYDEGDEVDTYTDNDGNEYKDIDYSTSAGSVTGNTQVDINGGTIHRNVYGGGSLASVGPPAIQLDRKETAYKPGTTKRDAAYAEKDDETIGAGWWSMNTVNVKGTVGTSTDYQEHYGGEVYGASRGDLSIGEDFGTSVWTQVFIKNGAHILGNVFGGGDNGKVKMDTDVQIGEPATTP